MGWESSGVVKFDLCPLLQGETMGSGPTIRRKIDSTSI